MAGGRPIGAKNKIGLAAKQALVASYEALGGDSALTQFGRDNPDAFYKLWGKLIPSGMEIEGNIELVVRVKNFTGTTVDQPTAPDTSEHADD